MYYRLTAFAGLWKKLSTWRALVPRVSFAAQKGLEAHIPVRRLEDRELALFGLERLAGASHVVEARGQRANAWLKLCLASSTPGLSDT